MRKIAGNPHWRYAGAVTLWALRFQIKYQVSSFSRGGVKVLPLVAEGEEVAG